MNEPDEKRIKAKQDLAEKRAGEGHGTGIFEPVKDRLPPGQKLVEKGWPVLDLGITPEIKKEEWELEILGEADAKKFSWDDFSALPQTKLTTDFHCVTTWSIYDANVEGVLWQEFLKHINVKEGATHAMFHAHDGYTTNLPLAEMKLPDVAIIHSYNGQPLDKTHGGPVRTWVPHLYGWKSTKWVKAIEFMNEDRKGFWEVRGYHNHGDPWQEERYS